MKKNQKLGNQDIRQLLTRGGRVESPLFRMVFRKNNLGFARFLFVISRKAEKHAVKRNRMRRRAREWLRQESGSARMPADIGIIFKKGASAASRRVLYEELKRTVHSIFSHIR